MEITVQKMNAASLADAAMIESTVPDAWSAAQLAEALHSSLWLCLLARADGAAAGTCIIQMADDTAEIHAVSVLPAYRRCGIGAALLQAAAAAVRPQAARLLLEVRESNEGAKALYTKLGFTVLGVRRDFYTNPRESAVIMEWKL